MGPGTRAGHRLGGLGSSESGPRYEGRPSPMWMLQNRSLESEVGAALDLGPSAEVTPGHLLACTLSGGTRTFDVLGFAWGLACIVYVALVTHTAAGPGSI